MARFFGMLNRGRREREFAEELESHLAMHIEDNLHAGMSPEEARRVALIKLGGVTRTQELHREQRGVPMLETLLQDLRFGVRMLRKNPGFSLIAVLTLALGIGANTAVFSLVNTVWLRPLPIAEPERVFEVTPLFKGMDKGAASYPAYQDYRDRNEALDGLAAYTFASVSMSQNGNNALLMGYLVSGNYFDLLGVRAVQGRMFTQEEDRQPGAHPVAVLSHGCWQRRFSGNPQVIGQTILINNHSFTVVGVAPPEFNGTALMIAPELYAPLNMAKQLAPASRWLESRDSGSLLMLGRLKPNIGAAQAKAEFDALAAQLRSEHPEEGDVRFEFARPGLVMPMMRNATFGLASVLTAIVGLVLLIACTNLANLLLARGAQRRKEIAVRLSLGATRTRLLRQLLTESLLLACAGGLMGWLLAQCVAAMVKLFKPPVDFPLNIDLKLDWRVLVFTLLISLVTGVLFGLLPAWQATKPDLVPALKDESGGVVRRGRLRSTLVVAQVALSLVLLTGAGLIVRSLQQAQMVGPGFDIEHTVTASVDLSLQGYDRARAKAFQQQLLTRIEALPGVRSASISRHLPLNLDTGNSRIYVEGQPFTRRADLPLISTNRVWPRYFETMGIPLLAGRDFNSQDDREETRRAIVNESFARRFFPGQNTVGRRLHFGGPTEPFCEIIGVVKDSKYESLGEAPQPFVFAPMMQADAGAVAFVARAGGDPQSLLNAIRREVARLDANLPIYDAKTMREHMRLSLFPLRAGAWVAGGFAFLALLLAGLGIYGVMSYATAQRTREIGIRLALGAQSSDVLRLALRQGLKLALLGLALGLTGALTMTRLMTSVLYGVSATDAATFGGVTLLLSLVVLLACYVPARRATKVDPMIALRTE
jgi:predicted permease